MLHKFYLGLGVAILGFYTVAALAGWEFPTGQRATAARLGPGVRHAK